MENYIFEIKDKTGRKIHLTKERWSHITSPSSPHSYMASYLEYIKETLIKPDKIINSFYDEINVNYYKYYKKNRKYLGIIVSI
ncbi:MAG: PBECR2 nuclease fold domain-containing protein [Candidatus Pacearchaeota archaeon]